MHAKPKIVYAHQLFAPVHNAYRRDLDLWTNSAFQVVESLAEADAVFYPSWGFSDGLAPDISRMLSLSKPAIIHHQGDQCITPDECRPDAYFFATHLNPRSNARQFEIPFTSRHGLTRWRRGELDWESPRPVFASFQGGFHTYEHRPKLARLRSDEIPIIDCDIWNEPDQAKKDEMERTYWDLLGRTRFALCPRGAGPSSCRLVESMLAGCLPVTFDDLSRPFGGSLDFVIRASFEDDLHALMDRLRAMPEDEYAHRREQMRVFRDTFLLADDHRGYLTELGHAAWMADRLQAETLGPVSSRADLGNLFERMKFRGEGVEVGTQAGHFAVELLSRWPSRLRLHLVDRWRHDASYRDVANVTDAEQERIHNFVLARFADETRVNVICSESVDAAARFADGSLDFIYLDADHRKVAALADLRAWVPKVRSGGVIAGHDWTPDGNYDVATIEVQSAFREFFPGRQPNVIPEDCGASWWIVKG